MRVHIKPEDHQAAKAYVQGLNDGLESAAQVVECGSFLSKDSPAYKWSVQVAGLIRAKKSEAVDE